LFILPIAVGTTLLGHRIISLLYPPEFFNAGITLQLLIWVAVFVYLNIVLKTVLVSINEQKKLTMTIFFGAILSVLLNFILIPSYSFMGASIAAITTEFATFIVCFLIVSRKLGMISIGFVFGVIVSAAIMGLFVWKLYLLNLLLLIALAALLYFVFLLVFRIIKKEEVNLVLHNLNIKLVK
jgi:O-antigen/teichoic acid export membrane protein